MKKQQSRSFIVYLLFNIVNEKYYVGQTTRKNCNRLNEHKLEKSNRYIHNAIKRYGVESFTVYVLANCSSIEELNKKERLWITILDACNPDVGYNMTSGGVLNWKHTETTRDFISSRCKNAWKVRGKLFITDGINIKRVSTDKEIPDGWYRGRPVSNEAKQNILVGVRNYHALTKRTKLRICYGCFNSFTWIGEGSGLGMFCSKLCSSRAISILGLNRPKQKELLAT